MGTTEYISLSMPTTAWLIDYLLLNTTAAVWLGNVYKLTVLDTTIFDTNGAGLVAINVFGSTLLNCSFRFNWPNCVFVFWDTWPTTEGDYHYSFHNFEIIRGYMDNGLLGAGLSMIFFQTEYHCQISIENLITMENLGQYSGLFFALEYCNREHISIHINGANCSHNNRDAVSLLVWKNDDLLCTTRRNFLGAMHSIMNISNAYFSKNLGVLSFKSTYIYQFDSAIRLVNITVVDNTSPLDL